MSRRRLPRRAFLAIGAAGVVCFAITASAVAQQAGSRTVYGAAQAQACAQGAITGNATDEALAACERALRTEELPPLARIGVYNNRGSMHLRRREGEAALADFDAILEIDRRNAEAHLNRGAAFIQMGQYGPAVATITQALLLGVRQPFKAYYNRGAAREALGDIRGAYEDYSTALEIQPDWGPAEAELARFARARREQLASVVGATTQDPARPGVQEPTEGRP